MMSHSIGWEFVNKFPLNLIVSLRARNARNPISLSASQVLITLGYENRISLCQ